MRRRDFLRAAAGAAALSGSWPRRGFAGETGAAKPNVLFILADDWRPDGIGALGNPHIHTPNLDRLVERGTVFTRTYVMGSNCGAVCTPSRTMLLTGRSVFHFRRGGFAQADDGKAAFWAKAMSRGGYETFHLGKKGNSCGPGMQAFETCLYTDDIGAGNHLVSSQKTADRVIAFLKERKDDRPFFVYMAPPVPHDPRVCPEEFMSRYDPASIPLPARYEPVHPFDNGEMTVRDEKLAPWPRTEAVIKRNLADAYACVTCLDYHIGRILRALEEKGPLENTLVIFAADNGLSLGDHGLMGKQNLYEFGGMHVPLVLAGPGIPHATRDALAYLHDVYPTVCELTGTPVPPAVESLSLVPVIRGAAAGVRGALFTAYRKCQRAVRDERWKVIRYPLVDVTQLFDLQNDPVEMKNLAGDPAYAGKLGEMMALLAEQQQRYDDPAPLRVPDPKPAAWHPPAGGAGAPRRGARKRKRPAATE